MDTDMTQDLEMGFHFDREDDEDEDEVAFIKVDITLHFNAELASTLQTDPDVLEGAIIQALNSTDGYYALDGMYATFAKVNNIEEVL